MSFMSLQISPLRPDFAARVTGIGAVGDMSDAAFTAARAALDEHDGRGGVLTSLERRRGGDLGQPRRAAPVHALRQRALSPIDAAHHHR